MNFDAIWPHIHPIAELTGEPLARLVRRLRARYPVSLPLREDADPQSLLAVLSAAGAEVTLSNRLTTVPTSADKQP